MPCHHGEPDPDRLLPQVDPSISTVKVFSVLVQVVAEIDRPAVRSLVVFLVATLLQQMCASALDD